MRKINFKKMFSVKNTIFSLLIFGAIFLFGHFASATIGGALSNVVGGIIALFIRAISSILILLVNVLMSVMSYSDFIHADAVTKGWIVVRDLCNMFFVVILLIIAFATILGQEEYGAKKMLPKLIMAAVLINFSKLICGLMIDLSSVVMLTFVNAFSAIGAGNILNMLGISSITQISVGGEGVVTLAMIVSSYIFGLIYIVIATVVIAAMLGMLVVRLVMIWILVVLSPFAFFLQAVPGGSKYASQWWTRWTSNLLVGPIVAFFLWLSFAALQGGNPINVSSDGDNELATNNSSIENAAGLGSEAGTTSAMAKFVIAIGMLLGGMQIAQSVGGEAGGAMGKIFNKGKGMATAAGIGALTAGGKAIGRGARNATLAGFGKVANLASSKDEITGKRKGNNVGNFALQWKDDLVNSRKKEKVASREKFLKKIGVGEKSAEIAQDIYNDVKKNPTVQSLNSIVRFKASNRKYNSAKNEKEAYENSGDKAADESEINSLKARMAANPNYSRSMWTANEILASERMKSYSKNSKIVENRDENPVFPITGKALKNMTEKKKRAKDRISVMARTPDYFKGLGSKGIYKKDGITDDQKRWLDMMNDSSDTDTDLDAHNALRNTISQLDGTGAPANQLDRKEANSMAKLLAAYKKGGGKMKALSALDDAVRNTNAAGTEITDSDALSGEVLVNYRNFDKSKMILNEGKGELEYDSFIKNSAKKPQDRSSEKDFIGASFAKINTRAREKGIDFKLDAAPAANLGKEQVDKMSLVMSSLLDDEINALESSIKQSTANNPVIKNSQEKIESLQKSLGDIKEPNSVAGMAKSNEIKRAINSEQQIIEKESSTLPDAQKLSQLKAAKKRFDDKDLSGLSLNNTDVIYKGETDSDKRKEKYNGIQHEQMHKAGLKNEELTHESADALQNARLIGRIPGTDKRYDTEIGRMAAQMEAIKIDPALIKEAIAKQIDSWKVSSAQRVVEIEKGDRQTVSESIKESEPNEATVGKTKEEGTVDNNEHLESLNKNIENLNRAIEKMSSNLGKRNDSSNTKASMSIADLNFFRRMFNGLNKRIEKMGVSNPKPITAMVANEETESKE